MRRNPATALRKDALYREIAGMLRSMPTGWRREYNKGRRALVEAGGPVLPDTPTPEQAMLLIGITAGGNPSGDTPYGPHEVPEEVRQAVMHGIRLSYREGYGAWMFIGLARAIELVIVPSVSDVTYSRMGKYLFRHAKDKRAARFGDDENPSNGYLAWLNWGGDPAAAWTRAFQRNPARKETYLEGVERREKKKGRGERAFDTAQTVGGLAVAGAKLGGRAIPVVGEVLMVAGAGKEAVKVARRRLKGGKGSWKSDFAKVGAGAFGLESFVPEAQPGARRVEAKKNPSREKREKKDMARNKDVCIVWNVGSIRGTRRRNPDRSELSEDKIEILDRIVDALVDRSGPRPVLVLAGAAGTGKTTLMRVVIDELAKRGVSSVLVAPTGKAALRLQEVTGLPANTIHSRFFTRAVNTGRCAACGETSPELGISAGRARREGITSVSCPHCGEVYRVSDLNKLKSGLEFEAKEDPSTSARVAIIDEASMVSKALDRRIRQVLPSNYALLYVGDKEQLPPVGTGEDAEWGPDWANAVGTLTKVHRQAAGNPIIDLATRIREDRNIEDPFLFTDPDADLPVQERRVRIYDRVSLAQAAKWAAAGRRAGGDATLIALTNRVRVELNKMVRRDLGLSDARTPVAVGDRLIVLNNNREAGMANGEIFNVSEVRVPKSRGLRENELIFVRFQERPDREFLIPYNWLNRPDSNTVKKEFIDFYRHFTSGWSEIEWRAHLSGVGRRPIDTYAERLFDEMSRLSADDLFDRHEVIRPDSLILVDFGECITAHKSQGSQWDTVGVIWDYFPQRNWFSEDPADYESARRWLYTAVTRAQRRLVVFKVR